MFFVNVSKWSYVCQIPFSVGEWSLSESGGSDLPDVAKYFHFHNSIQNTFTLTKVYKILSLSQKYSKYFHFHNWKHFRFLFSFLFFVSEIKLGGPSSSCFEAHLLPNMKVSFVAFILFCLWWIGIKNKSSFVSYLLSKYFFSVLDRKLGRPSSGCFEAHLLPQLTITISCLNF